MLKACAEQKQVIAGGGAALSLVDAATLTAPDGVSLPATLTMEQEANAWLRVVLDTHLGWDHTTVQPMRYINGDLLKIETEMDEYNTWDQGLKTHLPDSIIRWVQIWLKD